MTSQWGLFADLEAELATQRQDSVDDGIRVDTGRQLRSGVPEVVLSGHKTAGDVITAVRRLMARQPRVIVSRCSLEILTELRRTFAEDCDVTAYERTVVVAAHKTDAPKTDARAGIITAGTSDNIAAMEAAVILTEMGVECVVARDIGVAGLHRIVSPLRHMATVDVDVIIVAAGMDGALPSVIAGLVPVPVIGLPVSTGYGFGGNGEAALMSMLQSCAPGLAVVNIDNGIGAGSTAALIALRAARSRV